MIAALFLVLLHLRVARGFSKVYSQWKCSELHTLPQYVTASYYFILRESCELHISTRPITEQLYHDFHSNCSSRRSGRKRKTEKFKYTLFAWEDDQIAILRQNRNSRVFHAQVAIVNATKELRKLNKSYGNFPIAMFSSKFKTILPIRTVIFRKIMYETCHRHPSNREVWFRCYCLSGSVLTEQAIEYEGSMGRILHPPRKFNLPKDYSYGRSIASYLTDIGEHRLWVLNGKTLYDFDLNKVERGAYNSSNPLIYKIPDKHKFKTTKSEILFADAGSIITRRCYKIDSYKIDGCLYRYNIPRGNMLISRCIYDEMFDIQPALLSKSFSSQASGATTFYGLSLYNIEIIYCIQPGIKKDDGYGTVEWKGYNMAYAPVQVLGLITVVYLCFFFYYAFKPNPHSDLTELSKVMDEQLYQLSILTKEVAESMKRKEKQVMLKRRKTDITQASREVCSPGTTHRSSYENELRSEKEEAVKRKASKEVHKSKDILKSHTLTKARSKELMRPSAEGVLGGARAQKRPYQQNYENVDYRTAGKRINNDSKT